MTDEATSKPLYLKKLKMWVSDETKNFQEPIWSLELHAWFERKEDNALKFYSEFQRHEFTNQDECFAQLPSLIKNLGTDEHKLKSSSEIHT